MSNNVVRVVLDNTKPFTHKAYTNIRRAITKACFDCEADAKKRITSQGAIDTGAARASIYASTPNKSDYAKAVSAALSEARKGARKLRRRKIKGKAKRIKILPEVKPRGDMEGVVSVSVEYGPYIEYGTVKMPARPFLLPAAEAIEKSFIDVIEKAFNEAVDSI